MRIVQLIESENSSPDFVTIMEAFLPFVQKELKLEGFPKIKLQLRLQMHDQPSFGRFVNEENTIYLALEDRHPLDVIRTFAHELVHFRQGQEHQLDADSGATGSPEENEANELAGVIMRNFNKQHPEFFDADAINLKEDIGRQALDYKRGTRYPDGKPIPDSLPPRYQPDFFPGVPKAQHCKNCNYFSPATKKCSKFSGQPIVRPTYWCAKWEKIKD
jgi:hypothetical protein